MDKMPWDLIVTVIAAVLGSSGLWSFIEKRSGKWKAIDSAFAEIKRTLSFMRQKEDTLAADSWRRDILRYDAELRRREKHTFEEWADIVDTVDRYEIFCDTHKSYSNTRAVSAIENIKSKYKTCQEERDFL